jgi:hypothetical protein
LEKRCEDASHSNSESFRESSTACEIKAECFLFRGRQYRDVPQAEVAGVVEQFLAIGEDPEKFKAFVNTIEAQIAIATTF